MTTLMFLAPLWFGLLPNSDGGTSALHLEVPAGLEVELWGESPQLFNPTAIDVDERGRLWVTEAVNYRKWGGRNAGRTHDAGDRVIVLEDSDGDGHSDRSTVFAQDEELVSPLGILVLGEGRVLVSCSPHALLYIDDDGDDRADRREVFLTGFGGPNHDHGLHSFVPGPDGSLYFAAGNAGPHLVTDRGGWRLRSGSIYVGGGEFTADNKPGLISDDGRAWTGGLVLRVGSDGRELGVMAHNFRNNYEVALDSFGNLFVSDNDDDGNRGCRTLWAMEGGNYGYFSEDGARYWRADQRPGQDTQTAHWHQEDPGVSPAGAINGAGGPTGVCVYEGGLLGDSMQGAVLNADAGAGVVYAHHPVPRGAGFELEPDWLIRGQSQSEERSARWFRPSDVCVGPDGSVFVADWFDPGVGGHAAGDREAYGRILRVSPAGEEAPVAPIQFESTSDALRAFTSPVPSVRAQGARRLFDEPGSTLDVVKRAFEGVRDERTRARYLFGMARMGEPGKQLVLEFLRAETSQALRVAGLRALRSVDGVDFDLLRRLGRDPSAAVRREVMVALQTRGEHDGFIDLMLSLAGSYDGTDRDYLEAFGAAARGYEEELFSALSADFGQSPSNWSNAFADLAWRLHPASAVESFVARARDASLEEARRQQAINALAFMPERAAAEAMLNLALLEDGPVGELASYWIRHRDTNDWRDYGLAQDFALGDFGAAELLWESSILRTGREEAEVDLRGAQRLWLVVDDGGDGNSCDWADWIDPLLMFEDGERSLTEFNWAQAESAWGRISTSSNAGGGELRVEGKPIARGIGTHANSSIEYALPAGVRGLRFAVGPDDGGTGQNGGQTTSVRFRVFVERERDRSELLARAALVADESAAMEGRVEAVNALAQDPEGGLMLIQQARKAEWPQALRVAAQDSIFTNPDIAVRALASEVFTRPGEEQSALPAMAELLALSGDPARGRHLYQSEQALCATCHTFEGLGRDIGPDLTAVGTKYGKAELIDAILNPSAGISFGYDSWLMQVEGQGYLSGFVLADGEDVVLKDSSGSRHVIAKEDILFRERQETSIMPQGAALGLGAQGIADLAAFLLHDRAGEPIYGEPVVLFDGTHLDAWSFHLNDPAAGLEDVWSLEAGGVLRCKGNPIGYLSTRESFENFHLELEWRFDPRKGAGNSGVLLRQVGPDKVWPKSIEAQLHSRNAGDIWNIDKVAMIVDPARTSGRRTSKQAPCNEKPLGEWNHYAITMDRGDLTLVVNGDVQNTARWCDEVAGKICLQSEGAEILFRNIVLRPIVGHE